jgi:hypothetical protein
VQLTAADSGCWIDGHWGWRGSARLIELAKEFGWSDWTSDLREDDEFIHEVADIAEQWMNNSVAPDGHSFGWFDGEWFLWPYSTWEETE